MATAATQHPDSIVPDTRGDNFPLLERKLAGFRAAYPKRFVDAGGTRWEYVSAGRAGSALLLLGGALGEADFGFELIMELSRDFRVIAPNYPPVASIAELVSGLDAILSSEHAERVHVVGGSFGGVVAQAFAVERPQSVASLTLSHTGGPKRIRGAGAAVALLRLLPLPLLKALFRRRVRDAVAPGGPFWLERFEASVSAMTKAQLLSRVRIAAEFGSAYADAPPPQTEKVLIVDSGDDPLIEARHSAALRARFRRAMCRRFVGTGHIAAILQPVAFARAVRDFIRAAQR